MSVAVGCWLKKEEYSTVYGTCTSRSACQCLCYLVLVYLLVPECVWYVVR